MAPPWMRSVAAIGNVSEDDAEPPLDCGICFLPLEDQPSFKCDAGHVICEPCREMLALPEGSCHVCIGKAASPGSRRGHGRDVWPAYYEPRHRMGALRGPCGCPVDDCGFIDNTAALLCHFVSAHDWPVTTGVTSGESIAVRLQDGVNVVAVDCFFGASSEVNRRGASSEDNRRGASSQDSRRGASEDNRREAAGRFLLVLEVSRETYGRAVTAFCLRAGAAVDGMIFWSSRETRCQVGLSYVRNIRIGDDDDEPLVDRYYQKTKGRVPCTDLSRGMPAPEYCFQADVLRSVDLEDNEESIEVTLRVIIYIQ